MAKLKNTLADQWATNDSSEFEQTTLINELTLKKIRTNDFKAMLVRVKAKLELEIKVKLRRRRR